jgi:hypothetical protein
MAHTLEARKEFAIFWTLQRQGVQTWAACRCWGDGAAVFLRMADACRSELKPHHLQTGLQGLGGQATSGDACSVLPS